MAEAAQRAGVQAMPVHSIAWAACRPDGIWGCTRNCRIGAAWRSFSSWNARQSRLLHIRIRRDGEPGRTLFQRQAAQAGLRLFFARGKTPSIQTTGLLQKAPIQPRPGIGFAPRCNVFMAGDVAHRVALGQSRQQGQQGFILRWLKQATLQAFEFNADGKVIAVVTARKVRAPGMPGTRVTADKLPQFAATLDIKMRGDLQALDLFEIRVGVPVELVGEQLLHGGAAKLAWWQADGVQHQQVNRHIRRARAEIGGGTGACKGIPAVLPDRCLGRSGAGYGPSHPLPRHAPRARRS